MKILHSIVFYIIFSFFMAISAYMIYQSYTEFTLSQNSSNWEKFKAKVLVSKVVEEISTDDDGDETINYRSDISYTYTLKGVDYNSSKIGFGQWGYLHSSIKDAQKVIDKYEKGATIPIYINPSNPTQAILERRFNIGELVMSIVFSIFILIIFSIFLFVDKKSKE